MPKVAKKYQDQFRDIKKLIEDSHSFFSSNYKRYQEFTKFACKTTLTADDIAALKEMGMPEIEFNKCEAYISRLCGEFSKMQPGFVVRPQETVEHVDPALIKTLEGHFRAMLTDANNEGFSYDIYTDMLRGGFSVGEVYTDYVSPMSFDQKIYFERAYDPTLCGFDPLARMSHKGDGQYCFQLFPKTVDEAVAMYGSDVKKGLKVSRSIDGFSWSYKANKQDILLICDFYKKEYKKEKIIKLSNGRVVTESDYQKLMENWELYGAIEQAPQPTTKPRATNICFIRRYRISGGCIIDVTDTNYTMLPLVFFDGNSAIVKDSDNSTIEQVCRPYIYNIKDAQRLTNYAGQSLANELENTIEHKFVAAIESIPEDYMDAYINVQKPSTLLYNAFLDGDSSVALPPPREIARTQIPPEISRTFEMSDKLMQSILGSYDAALGINNKELSGVAIMQGAMHSNAASMPYTVGFIKGLNRVSQITLDLIPKYYVTPRSIPVVSPDNKRSYEVINKKNTPSVNYDIYSLGVQVESGVNFEVQKQISLETIIQLMQASESFKAFMNEKGLSVLLDNIDIRGIDALREMAGEYMQEIQQQKKIAQQQQMKQMQEQVNPQEALMAQTITEQEKTQQKREESELDAQVRLTKIAADDAVKNKQADVDFMEAMSKIQNSHTENVLREEEVDAENARTAVDLATSLAHAQSQKVEKVKTDDKSQGDNKDEK